MAVAGPDRRFYFASFKMPGFCHDARVLRLSDLYSNFNSGYRPFPGAVIIGDSAYPLLPWLIPMNTHGTADAQRFYRALAKTRQIVESAFGVLKQRWRCLLSGIRVDTPLYAATIIKACFYLHNFVIERRLEEEDDDAEFDEDLAYDNFDDINASEDAEERRVGNAREILEIHIRQFIVEH